MSDELKRRKRLRNPRAFCMSPEYQAWASMRKRCTNPKHASYHLYGGRGISICERWVRSAVNFVEDMGLRPKGHSLERIDVDGNYEPSNCTWASTTAQCRNRQEHTREDIGVSQRRLDGMWCAFIGVGGRNINLGEFRDKARAIEARKAGEMKHWGAVTPRRVAL